VNNAGQFRDPFRELIEAYALGSLDSEQRVTVAEHLAAGCAECTKALEEARLLVSQLSYLAPEAAPLDTLRGRLLETVRAEAAAAKSNASAICKSAIPLWMWGAVAAVLFFALYNAYEAHSLRETIHETREALTAQMELQQESARRLAWAQREALILTDPRSMKIAMSADAKGMPELQATWHHSMGIVVRGRSFRCRPEIARCSCG